MSNWRKISFSSAEISSTAPPFHLSPTARASRTDLDGNPEPEVPLEVPALTESTAPVLEPHVNPNLDVNSSESPLTVAAWVADVNSKPEVEAPLTFTEAAGLPETVN